MADLSASVRLAAGRTAAATAPAGRPAALADLHAFYLGHVDFVRRAVARLGGPAADVDDLAHEVFLVVLRRPDAFEGRSAASTWLYGIAVRVVAAARRRARLRRFLGLDDAPARGEAPDAAGTFEHLAAAETVYRVLERIAERKRTVFILFELEGLSGEEIAAAVGCPVKTVWTRLHHARREFTAGLKALEKGRA
jgi:RNA polymerase sigma-70 factor (ECF subfamily)